MIRIVWGTGHAPTEMAAFDDALAAANVHQYNLRELSSVIPAHVPVEAVGTAPDLGPTGNVLDAVLARRTSLPGAPAVAGLTWARDDDGAGIFYEAGGDDPDDVADRLDQGITHGCAIREIEAAPEKKLVTTEATPEHYAAAVVLAVYGESESLFG